MTTTAQIEWVFDSEGCYVCSDCWDDEMRDKWPRVEMDDELDAYTEMYCESCHRWGGEEAPEWMRTAAKDEVIEAARTYLGDGYGDLDRLRAAFDALASLNRPFAPVPIGEDESTK